MLPYLGSIDLDISLLGVGKVLDIIALHVLFSSVILHVDSILLIVVKACAICWNAMVREAMHHPHYPSRKANS